MVTVVCASRETLTFVHASGRPRPPAFPSYSFGPTAGLVMSRFYSRKA